MSSLTPNSISDASQTIHRRMERICALAYWVESSTVADFMSHVYRIPIMISFNWPAWEEGRTMLEEESFDFNSIDIPTKCKLISTIVRIDRFCEGELVDAFESGLILKLLESIKEQLPHN